MFWNKTRPAQTYKEVIQEEAEQISLLRVRKKTEGIRGLGISGGGIRSASVGLGVMQALVAAPGKSILSQIDYLSTVSGGGYIGSALTWFLQKGLPDGKPAGTDPENFPLGQIGQGTRSEPGNNQILNYIRQHGNYLLPGYGLNGLSLFGVAIRSIFISLFVYLAMLTVILTALNYCGLFNLCNPGIIWGIALPSFYPLFAISFLVMLILGITSFTFSVRTSVNLKQSLRYKNQILVQKLLGLAWGVIIFSALLGSLIYVKEHLPLLEDRIIAALSSISIGTIIGFFQHKKSVSETNNTGGMPVFIIYFAAFVLIYGLVLLSFSFSFHLMNFWVFSGLCLLTLILGYFVNLNYVGLHRMYRDRLMETFMPNLETIRNGKWAAATEADEELLKKMCVKNPRPYHLINTNIVLVDSPNEKFRGRGGDSFVLSPKYCGSDATGYISTEEFMNDNNKLGSRGMTLSTAMAISGAAVNPNTGSGGRGPTRNQLVSTLMGLLNLRLGYWARNPKKKNLFTSRPTFFSPGLSGDVLGGALTEDQNNIQLTDGGHFENLGLYELIRRKAKVIILSDAGADASYQFSDLANAIEKVRVDFGATIRFNKKYCLSKLLPGSSTNDNIATIKYQLAERGFALADINYHDEEKTFGKLIYIKSTLTAGLPADIYGYKSANPSFPNQTTANQFFNEEQFEAYRELGYQLTWQMLNNKKCRKILGIEEDK